MHQHLAKSVKKHILPAFGVLSTQTLVEIYNNCFFEFRFNVVVWCSKIGAQFFFRHISILRCSALTVSFLSLSIPLPLFSFYKMQHCFILLSCINGALSMLWFCLTNNWSLLGFTVHTARYFHHSFYNLVTVSTPLLCLMIHPLNCAKLT